MGAIEEVYEDLDDDVPEEEFREAVEAKAEQMGGLADDETAAMLVAHELGDKAVTGVADVEAGMDDVGFLAQVCSVGELREFERDTDQQTTVEEGAAEDEESTGTVLNADVADETGRIRVTFWDDHARSACEELEVGQTLRISGRATEGYSGVEVSVDRVEHEPDADIDVDLSDDYNVEDLAMGLSDVTLVGTLLSTDPVRTFDRDDGSEGSVSNLVLGDQTGRVRVTLWDERAALVEDLEAGATLELVGGYVRERDGEIELHVGDRGRIEAVEEAVTYVPDATAIDAVELGSTVDLAGVVRSSESKNTFERDDGSDGQVRNISIQDDTGEIRVALWGDLADRDIGPGDQILAGDVEIKDGWQDEKEASAGWQSTVVKLDDAATVETGELSNSSSASETGDGDDPTGLDAYATDGDSTAASETAASSTDSDSVTESPGDGDAGEFTGVVVQSGDPIILDDGEETLTVDVDADVTLGEELTVQGEYRDGQLVVENLV